MAPDLAAALDWYRPVATAYNERVVKKLVKAVRLNFTPREVNPESGYNEPFSSWKDTPPRAQYPNAST
jgi:hypothetical protein